MSLENTSPIVKALERRVGETPTKSSLSLMAFLSFESSAEAISWMDWLNEKMKSASFLNL